jgi:hypothetical protein
VLWELIVGHRLYQDPDPQEKLRRVRAAEIPHPREQGSDIDDELWSVLQRALARERDDRYPTAELFEEDLRAWLYTHARCGPPDVVQTLRDAFPHESAGTGADGRRGSQRLRSDLHPDRHPDAGPAARVAGRAQARGGLGRRHGRPHRAVCAG